MEFNEKLQQLRKQKGLTQEELAQALYVSRTAISKWESGRGYPNIDSLKALAKFFHITIDELLSGEELLSMAEEENHLRKKQILDLVFGLLDCSILMVVFLPLFGQYMEGEFRGISLLFLNGVSQYLKTAYYIAVIGLVLSGLFTLRLRDCKRRISLLLNTVGVLLFIISRQPYAATFLFFYLSIKGILLLKNQ